VAFERDAEVRPQRFAHRGNVLADVLNLTVREGHVRHLAGIPAELVIVRHRHHTDLGLDSLNARALDKVNRVFRLVGVEVDGNLVAHAPTHQPVNGQPQRLAGKVPKRHINAAHGRHVGATSIATPEDRRERK
jgi:hypothetical protein